MFNEIQMKEIRNHLRRSENEEAIANIAGIIAKEYGKVGGNISEEEAKRIAMIMNLGETDERIAHIYDKSCNWKEHPEAIELNKLHGKYSVEMASKMGIELTEEQKNVISGHSRGDYSSTLGQIIKIAEVCRATESSRWYRGEKKEAAQSWEEVASVLREDRSLEPGLIALAGNSYGREKFPVKGEEEIEK